MKTTRKAFLTSVMALMLCIVMLTGTTFAWFTDTVTSSGNKIQAGNLILDLEMLDATTGTWFSIKESTAPIFNYSNWEPGHTEVTILKVENEGNLALKWQARFISNDEVSALAKAINVYVLPSATALSYPANRSDLTGWQSVGTLDSFINTLSETTYGTLGAYECAYLGIALEMDKEAGNEYQKIGLNAFDIQIVATQLNSEFDSFGPDYDVDADWGEGTVSNDGSIDVPADAVENGYLTKSLRISDEATGMSVIVPSGVKLADGANELVLEASVVTTPQHNITFDDAQEVTTFEVHVEGIADDNTVPVTVNLGNNLGAGIKAALLDSYHIENGVAVPMEYVSSPDYFTKHNQFTYDSVTGETIIHIATFSEFVVAENEIKYFNPTPDGELIPDYEWYENKEFIIDTPEDLLGLAYLVDEGIEDFSGVTVTLGANISLAYENGKKFNFDPIGNQKDGKAFRGTFDGNNKVIMDLYQSGWDLGLAYADKDGLGLFAYLDGATVKNLQLDGFDIVMEAVIMGNLAGYAYGGCTFENIAITNSSIANYNWYTGGVVGWCGGQGHKFTNVSVDHTNTVSALWGTYDAALGGLIGGTSATATIKFDNCTVAANIDAYNDVCANYQWYAYRYCGMLIGETNLHDVPDATRGTKYATVNSDNIEFNNCNVYYGKDINRYYCELVANSIASYTHDHQFSRLTEIKAINGNKVTYLDGTEGTVPATGRANYVIVNYAKGHGTNNATCYHFVDGQEWKHEDAGTEIINGVEIMKEDNHHIYIPFSQLFGGGQGVYGQDDWAGVTTHRPEEQTKTVYFKNDWKWNDIKIYYWYSNGESYEWTNCAWPGQSMKSEGNNKYSFEIPVYAYGFIVNGTYNGEQVQTANIAVATISDGDTITPILDKNKILDDGDNLYKVYFRNDWLWNDIKCYLWGSSNSTYVINSWPGNELKKVGYDGSYYVFSIDIPKDAKFLFNGIKNDGSGTRDQSPDITSGAFDGAVYYMHWNSGNKVSQLNK